MTDGTHPAARIFDGARWHDDAALVVAGGRVRGIEPATGGAGWIVPGFVDLQVNGGGGVQFNSDPTPEGIATICAAHAAGGTTALLVTLITDVPALTTEALAAVRTARQAGQPGLAGVHLEGPHFALAKKGTHAPDLIRRMEDADVTRILDGAPGAGHVLVTLAPEAASPELIRRLAGAGVQVSLGHSDTDVAGARAAFDAGATMGTHLFNAMSGLGHRNPGLVGAILDDGRVWCGLICDGHHVDATALRIALRAKLGPGRLFIVTDAMAATGSTMTEFTLNGRTVYRSYGRLTLADGTLAGADVTMLGSVRHCLDIGVALDEALRMAALYPAEAAGLATKGRLTPGADADFLRLDPDLSLRETWIGGARRFADGVAA